MNNAPESGNHGAIQVSDEILHKLRQLTYSASSRANPVVGRFIRTDDDCTMSELLVLYDIMGSDVFQCVSLEDAYDRRLNPARAEKRHAFSPV